MTDKQVRDSSNDWASHYLVTDTRRCYLVRLQELPEWSNDYNDPDIKKFTLEAADLMCSMINDIGFRAAILPVYNNKG